MLTKIEDRKLTTTLDWYEFNTAYCRMMGLLTKHYTDIIPEIEKKYGSIEAESYKQELKDIELLSKKLKEVIDSLRVELKDIELLSKKLKEVIDSLWNEPIMRNRI